MYEGDASAKTFVAARINTLNINEENTALKVLLYPNPAQGASTLLIKGNTNNITVSMMDISGKTILHGNFTNRNRIDLPVDKFNAGVYMITVKNKEESKIVKLIKE